MIAAAIISPAKPVSQTKYGSIVIRPASIRLCGRSRRPLQPGFGLPPRWKGRERFGRPGMMGSKAMVTEIVILGAIA